MVASSCAIVHSMAMQARALSESKSPISTSSCGVFPSAHSVARTLSLEYLGGGGGGRGARVSEELLEGGDALCNSRVDGERHRNLGDLQRDLSKLGGILGLLLVVQLL